MSSSKRPVWLVTGAAGVLGSELVRRAMHQGADCIALDRNARGLEALHDGLQEELGRAPALMPMDLAGATPEDYERLAAAVENEFGQVDVLLHNAAVFHALQPLLLQPPGEWLETLQTSLTAPYMLTAVLAQLMPRDAAIVLVGDGTPRVHSAGWGAYGIAQAGRQQLAEILKAERVPGGARVVEVDPGAFSSPLRSAAWPSEPPGQLASVSEAAERVLAALAAEQA